MKGLFIPGITAEMFRNGCLESIEALMAEGEIYDIEYPETEDEDEIPADRDYADDNGVKKSDVLKHFGITPKELFKPGNFSSMPPKEDAWRKLSHFHEFEEQADPDKIVCIKFYYDAKFPRAYLSVCGLKSNDPEEE